VVGRAIILYGLYIAWMVKSKSRRTEVVTIAKDYMYLAKMLSETEVERIFSRYPRRWIKMINVFHIRNKK
jgi:hypothetical protein